MKSEPETAQFGVESGQRLRDFTPSQEDAKTSLQDRLVRAGCKVDDAGISSQRPASPTKRVPLSPGEEVKEL